MITCEVCEGKAPLNTKISVSQKGNFLYSAEVKSGEMVFCATVQNTNGPSFEILKFECDFCPKCGRKIKYLKESEYDPKNNWIDRLHSYCEKYGVCLDEDRPLNVKFFMELVDKMDEFNRGNVDE